MVTVFFLIYTFNTGLCVFALPALKFVGLKALNKHNYQLSIFENIQNMAFDVDEDFKGRDNASKRYEEL